MVACRRCRAAAARLRDPGFEIIVAAGAWAKHVPLSPGEVKLRSLRLTASPGHLWGIPVRLVIGRGGFAHGNWLLLMPALRFFGFFVCAFRLSFGFGLCLDLNLVFDFSGLFESLRFI